MKYRRHMVRCKAHTVPQAARGRDRHRVQQKKKGAIRYYYPLFCTVARTAQVLDFVRRPGGIRTLTTSARC
ncbi:MAG: hypothetical protein KatS3mg110_0601 [Pirellulaceae bacterium]|nr:MAG: hypothetical protein KatS3mg110_0601 [Pirellulaceae bacterium]